MTNRQLYLLIGIAKKIYQCGIKGVQGDLTWGFLGEEILCMFKEGRVLLCCKWIGEKKFVISSVMHKLIRLKR